MTEKRNIALYIVLSIITCGIFAYYWVAVLNDDVNKYTSQDDTSGGMVVLFSIITCGIYYLYWQYKMGEKIDSIKASRGEATSNSAIIYLLLGLFGFSIVSVALMQSELNKI